MSIVVWQLRRSQQSSWNKDKKFLKTSIQMLQLSNFSSWNLCSSVNYSLFCQEPYDTSPELHNQSFLVSAERNTCCQLSNCWNLYLSMNRFDKKAQHLWTSELFLRRHDSLWPYFLCAMKDSLKENLCCIVVAVSPILLPFQVLYSLSNLFQHEQDRRNLNPFPNDHKI